MAFFVLFTACNTEDATEYQRTNAEFLDSLGGNISAQQWWRTSVTLKINVTTDEPTKIWLLFLNNGRKWLCDYKEVTASSTITMTAPQGQGEVLYLKYLYNNKVSTKSITLSGKIEEFILPTEDVFQNLNSIFVNEESARIIDNGNPLMKENLVEVPSELKDCLMFNVYNTEKKFVAVYQFDQEKNILKPYKMFF